MSDVRSIPTVQKIIAVLWPSFLTAGVATILFFTAFDPWELSSAADLADSSRLGIYTSGFFLFWLLTATTSLLTVYFQRPCPNPDTK
jgi:hypothetical protein